MKSYFRAKPQEKLGVLWLETRDNPRFETLTFFCGFARD